MKRGQKEMSEKKEKREAKQKNGEGNGATIVNRCLPLPSRVFLGDCEEWRWVVCRHVASRYRPAVVTSATPAVTFYLL